VSIGAAGVPDLAMLLRRHGLADPWRIGQAWRWCPVRYVLFDLLYHGGRCLLGEPLAVRRRSLAGLFVPLPRVLHDYVNAAEDARIPLVSDR
jgi:ATP-dependent DNA ligase